MAEATNPREDWSHLSPQEIVRRTRCEADDWVDIGAPATWRTCCDLILRRLKSASAPSPEAGAGGDLGELADSFVQRVAEWDDRTSPEDWPEAMLITGEELKRELLNFAAEVSRSGKLVASTGSGKEETKGEPGNLADLTGLRTECGCSNPLIKCDIHGCRCQICGLPERLPDFLAQTPQSAPSQTPVDPQELSFGPGCYDFASSVASKVAALPWAWAETGDAQDDRYSDVQMIVDAELRSLAPSDAPSTTEADR